MHNEEKVSELSRTKVEEFHEHMETQKSTLLTFSKKFSNKLSNWKCEWKTSQNIKIYLLQMNGLHAKRFYVISCCHLLKEMICVMQCKHHYKTVSPGINGLKQVSSKWLSHTYYKINLASGISVCPYSCYLHYLALYILAYLSLSYVLKLDFFAVQFVLYTSCL